MLRILIAEDEDVIRRGLVCTTDWLSMDCVVVAEASDGQEGLEKILESRPDVVIADICMPCLDGIEMIRQAEGTLRFKSILLTSYEDFEFAKRAIEAKVSAYLLKPVDEEELARVIVQIQKEIDLERRAERALRKTEEEGFPETMCSYHRVFLGAALTGILPKPNCMIYTNLACDGNMMTFPYLKDKFECPGFYIDVPYEKNRESVLYVADQLRKLKRFLEETTDRRISEETVRSAVDNSRKAAANYKKQLALRCAHDPVTSLTNELYALFMCHLMAGSETAVTYTEKLLRDVRMSPRGDGLSVIWMHIMPFLQEPVKDIFNYSKKMHIRACDFIADGFQEMHAEDPYEAMAEKMVYCIYNGSVKQRVEEAERLARITEADGAVLFAHWGCKGTIGASSLIKQSLEKTGLPTMILDGDGCNPANTSDGQVSTRLQAFVEMLEKGKEEKHA